MTTTIAFASRKGGAGKTIASTNVAMGLVMHGANVLFIDLDPQATATASFGINLIQNPHPSVGELLHAPQGTSHYTLDDALMRIDLEDDEGSGDGTQESTQEGLGELWVLPAQYSTLEAAETGLDYLDRVMAVRTKIIMELSKSRVLPKIDVVVIDTRPSLGVLTANALAAADYVIPVCADYLEALSGAKSVVDKVDTLHEHGLSEIKVKVAPWVLANWSTKIGQEAKEVLGLLKELGISHFSTRLPQGKTSSKTPAHYGLPVVALREKDPFSQKAKQLVEEIITEFKLDRENPKLSAQK